MYARIGAEEKIFQGRVTRLILPGVDFRRATESWSWIRRRIRRDLEEQRKMEKEKSLTKAMLVLRFGVLKITFKPFLLYSHPHFPVLSLSLSLLLTFSYPRVLSSCCFSTSNIFLYPRRCWRNCRDWWWLLFYFLPVFFLCRSSFYHLQSFPNRLLLAEYIGGLPCWLSRELHGKWMLEWTWWEEAISQFSSSVNKNIETANMCGRNYNLHAWPQTGVVNSGISWNADEWLELIEVLFNYLIALVVDSPSLTLSKYPSIHPSSTFYCWHGNVMSMCGDHGCLDFKFGTRPVHCSDSGKIEFSKYLPHPHPLCLRLLLQGQHSWIPINSYCNS